MGNKKHQHQWEQALPSINYFVCICGESMTNEKELCNRVKDFVETLFVDGNGNRADRLVLFDDIQGLDLGVWSRSPVIDRVMDFVSSEIVDAVRIRGRKL